MGKYVLAYYDYNNPPPGLAVIDLSTLTWTRIQRGLGYSFTHYFTAADNVKTYASTEVAVAHIPGYKVVSANSTYSREYDMSFSIQHSPGDLHIINDSITDVNEFKASLSGVKLIYELKSNVIPYDHVPCSYYALYHNINLWDEQWRLGFFDQQGVFYGTVPSLQRLCSKNPVKVTPGSTIKVNVNNTDAYYIYQFDSNMSFVGETHFTYSPTGYQAELANNCEYIQFSSRDNKTGYKVHTVIYTGTKSEDAINTNQYLLEVLVK